MRLITGRPNHPIDKIYKKRSRLRRDGFTLYFKYTATYEILRFV